MGFGISAGFQSVDSYEFLFAPHATKCINICKFVDFNFYETQP